MADPILRIGAKFDGSGIKSGAQDASADLKQVGDTAKSAFDSASKSADSFAESVEAANARYKAIAQTAVANAQSLSVENAARSQSISAIDAQTTALGTNTAARVANNTALNASTVSMTNFQALSKDVQASLESEAATLADTSAKRSLYSQALQAGVIDQQEYSNAVKAVAAEEVNLQKAQANSAATAQKLFQTYGGSSAALEKLAIDEAKINSLFQQGAISGEQYVKSLSGIANARSALTNAAQDVNGLTSSLGKLSFTSAQVTRDYGLLAKDLATGQFSLAEREVSTLASRTGLLSLAFSGVGAAIGGVLLVFGSLIALAVSASNEENEFNKAIILTGNYAGVTTKELEQMVDVVGSQTGKFTQSQEAILGLANSGKVAGDDLQIAAQGVVEYSALTGKSIDETIKAFVKIQDEPVKAVEAFNDQLHFLSAAQDQNIRDLQDEGDKTDAAALATKLLVDALNTKYTQYTSQVSGIASGWSGVTGFIDKAVQSSKDFFNSKPPAWLTQVPGYILQGATFGLAGGPDNSGNATTQSSSGDAAVAAAANKATIAKNAETAAVNAFVIAQTSGDQKVVESNEKYLSSIDKSKTEEATATIQKQLDAAATQFQDQALTDAQNAILSNGQAMLTSAAAADKAAAAKKGDAAAARLQAQEYKELQKTVEDQAKAQLGIAQIQADADAELAGTGSSAVTSYEAKMKALNADYAVFLKDGPPTLALQAEYQKAADTLYQGEQKKIALDKQNHDYAAIALEDLTNQVQAQEAYGSTAQTLLVVEKAYQQSVKDGHPLSEQALQDLYNQAGAREQQLAQLQQIHDAINTFSQAEGSLISGVSTDFANFIDGATKGWKAFGQSLVQTAQSFIGAIIAEFVKLEIFSAITGQSFNFSQLLGAGLSAGLGGGGLIGGGTTALIGGNAISTAGIGGVSSVGSTGVSSIFDPTSWIGAGKNLVNGFQTGFQNIGNTAGNLYSSINGSAYTYTPPVYNEPSVDPVEGVDGASNLGQFGGYGSQLGQVIGIGGAIVAGINEFNAAGGGLGGLAGGAAYGAATYLGGAAISATLGGGLGAGVAALGALGPIGWAALAAVAINVISGGKLFGTAATKFVSAQSDLTIDATGADLSNTETLKGQKALFGGSYTKTKNLTVTSDAQDAANAFYQALLDQRTAFATTFGQSVGSLVGGSFITTYDKSGKATGTSDTVNGVTYTGETQDQFGERLQAGNIADVLDKLGVSADAFLSGAESDADKLIAQAQDLAATAVAVQKNIAQGFDLLGPGGSLADVLNLTISLQQSGEALSDTYARLIQEQAALKTNIDYAGISAGKTAADMVIFADAAASAAGGVDNLTKLISTFNQDFYTAAAQTATTYSALKEQVGNEGKALGEDPNESNAQFLQDYQKALPTLTAAQLVQWQQFGVDLFSLNSDINTFTSQFQTNGIILTQFEESWTTLGQTTLDNITQAQALGVATPQLIQNIVNSGLAGAQTLLASLITATQTISDSIFGSEADRLQQTIDSYNAAGIDDFADQKKLAALNGQQSQAAQVQSAQQLLGNFGQIGAITGQSLDQLLQEFGGNEGTLESILGVNATQLQAAYTQQVQTATAALDTATNTEYANELLADINAELANQPEPFSLAQLTAALTGPGDGATPGPGDSGVALGSRGGITAGTGSSRFVPVNAGTTTATTPAAGATGPTAPAAGTGGTTTNTDNAIEAIPDRLDSTTDALTKGLAAVALQLQGLVAVSQRQGFNARINA